LLDVEKKKEKRGSAHENLIKNREKGKDEAKKVEKGENENLGILISNIGVLLAAIANLFAKFLLIDKPTLSPYLFYSMK
jgi:hypothetical protein